MATGFNGEDLIAGESFSHLLDSGDVMGLDMTASFIYPSSFFMGNSPNMLCFGNVCDTGEKGFNEEKVGVAQRSVVTGSDSSSPSLSNNNNNSSMISKLKKSQNKEANQPPKRQNESGLFTLPGAAIENRKTCKRAKIENPTTSSSPIKPVRKEKLGERITALQQLVSPFGKTDAASVLHEAMAYIRFLHDQIRVLTSPYLQRRSSSAQLRERGREKEEEDETRKNLRSRGLCLVPVACATHVANSNGADFWSPAVRCYSSTSKQH